MGLPKSETTIPKTGNERALLISSEERDHKFLDALFQRHGWALENTNSLSSASNLLHQKSVSLVITERDLPDGGWKDVLEAVHSLPAVPLVVVISRFADDYLWAEALNLGAYDVLLKPLDETEVFRVLTSAWTRLSPKTSRKSKPVKEASTFGFV